MWSMGVQGAVRGKPVGTTISDKATPCPLDHVNRQFKAPRPNPLWGLDFAPDHVRGRLYVAVWTGFLHVAFVIDAHARRIPRAGLRRPEDRLWLACLPHGSRRLRARCAGAGPIRAPARPGRWPRAPQRAWQPVCLRNTERRAEAGSEPSVGRPGDSGACPRAGKPDPGDNALAETINGLYKAGLIHGVGHGGRSGPSRARRWKGSTGAITAGCRSPSATSRRPKPKTAATPCGTNSPWRPDANQTASDKPRAVHCRLLVFLIGPGARSGQMRSSDP
jgi:putative transposase